MAPPDTVLPEPAPSPAAPSRTAVVAPAGPVPVPPATAPSALAHDGGSAGADLETTAVDAEVDRLERTLTVVGRAILRLGVPPDALRRGEHVDRSGYWVMYRLDESGGAVRLSDLAALLELDLSTVSRQVRPLVDGGLVVRQSDPLDGRACLLSLSRRGRSVLEAVRQSRRDVLGGALGRWEPGERAAMVEALARLAADLQPAPEAASADVGPRRLEEDR